MMRVDTREEFAAERKPREFTQDDCKRIAAAYKTKRAAGLIKKPLSLLMARILNTAVSDDR